MKKLIVITGPTGTGRTALGVEVAKRINGEIISTDSMQIYRHMDVGTAKVTSEEKQGVPHYMIDVVEPTARYTVADYQAEVLPIIEDEFAKGKTPILVGGTGMYINAVLYEMTFSTYDENIRENVLKMTETMTNQELWDELYSLDKIRAGQLEVNDVHRVARAIEVALNGKSNSSQEELNKPRYNADIYVLSGERSEIYDRINKRVDIMLANGLLDEVKSLVDLGCTAETQSFGAIAYKEFYAYLTGEYDYGRAVELIKQRSRNYAKRQLTWCRKYYPEAIWLNYLEKEKNLETIIKNYGLR